MQSLVFWLAVCALTATEPSDDVLRVRLEASAPGTGTEGRMAAVTQAQEDAILQVVKAITGSEDSLPFRGILDNASAYVRSYQVLEQKENGGTTEVKVDAYILDKRLRRDLASVVLPLFPKAPRVVIVVTEGEGALPEPALEAKLAETFRNAGLEVVDPAATCAKLDEAEVKARIKGDGTVAAKFAWENLADVAVVGEATVTTEAAPRGSNLRPNRANMVLRIIRGGDAKIFDVQTAEAVVTSVDSVEGCAMALSDACDKVKEPALVSAVLAAAGAKGTPYVVVTVDGLESPEQWQAICERAKSCSGVEDAEQLHFSGSTGRLRLKYGGPMGPLVDALTEQPYAGYRIAPRQVVEHDITLAVAR